MSELQKGDHKGIIGWKVCIIIYLILTVLLSSCSVFNSMFAEKVRKPEVDFIGARVNELSFDSVGLLFDLKIRNPNSLGLKMAGFSYDLLINNSSFVKGNQDRELEISARGENTVQIPVSIGFLDLYQVFQSLLDQDVSRYQINCSFSFDVPVLGVVSIPVSKDGEFPLLKLPKVSLDSLKLRNLTLSGAELTLRIGLGNPNSFSMIFSRLKYQLEINGESWISGDAKEGVEVAEKGEAFLDIPIRLNFIQMGRSAYQLLNRDESLNYQFGGMIDLATSMPLLEQVNLPFDYSGLIKVLR